MEYSSVTQTECGKGPLFILNSYYYNNVRVAWKCGIISFGLLSYVFKELEKDYIYLSCFNSVNHCNIKTWVEKRVKWHFRKEKNHLVEVIWTGISLGWKSIKSLK